MDSCSQMQRSEKLSHGSDATTMNRHGSWTAPALAITWRSGAKGPVDSASSKIGVSGS
jgi:hypothetical protein